MSARDRAVIVVKGVPEPVHQWIRNRAAATGQSVSEVVRSILRAELARLEKVESK